MGFNPTTLYIKMEIINSIIQFLGILVLPVIIGLILMYGRIISLEVWRNQQQLQQTNNKTEDISVSDRLRTIELVLMQIAEKVGVSIKL